MIHTHNKHTYDISDRDATHSQAAKRLAGYLRLTWQSHGGGPCKVLSLRRTLGAGPPDLEAVENLLASLERNHNGATTKRRPV